MPIQENGRSAPEFDSPTAILRCALWFAVLLGIGQALFATIARLAGHLILISPDVIWMAPMANAVVFGFAAIGVRLITRRLDRTRANGVALTVLVLLSLLGPFLMVHRLWPLATLTLSCGLAIQAGRMLRERIELLDALIRRTLPWLISLCIALGLVLHLSNNGLERRAEASLPLVAPNAPNVILIVLDTVRAQNLSLYGYQRRTSPHLDEFARNGAVFEHALSTAPWTLPSHASFFTGRLPHELSADWSTPLDATQPTIAEAFTSRGYLTAGFVGNLQYTAAVTGLNRGFIHYSDFPLSAQMLVQNSWIAREMVETIHRLTGAPDPGLRKSAVDVNHEFLAWIALHPRKPFFAFLNYFDAHAPYRAPPPIDKIFGGGVLQPDITDRRKWSKEKIQWLINDYDGALAYLDEQVGILLDTLRARHLLDNTIVVITSDHGEQFGEHGLFEHANSLYRPLLQVPLVVWFPAVVPAGLRISTPVTLLNLPATILALAGVTTASIFPGHSLTEYWNSSPHTEQPGSPLFAEVSKGLNLPDWLPVSKGPMQSVVVGGMHYIRNGDGREELYDFLQDVAEEEDLASRPNAGAALRQARLALDEAQHR